MNIARRSVLSAVVASATSAPLMAAAKLSPINDLQGLIDKAVEGAGTLHLPAGSFSATGLRIAKPIRIEGVPGYTKLVAPDARDILTIEDTQNVTLSGLSFVGVDTPITEQTWDASLVRANRVKNLVVENCSFEKSGGSGLRVEYCSGRVATNLFHHIEVVGLWVYDCDGVDVSSNIVHDMGNNGIQVFRKIQGEDGARVTNNHVYNVKANAGGSGQNGNGINVFLANNVIIANNRVHDTAYSGIRNNSGNNCQIIGNNISRSAETAIYVEFGFQGAVVANNIIEDAAWGISITNFDKDGRLAICTGNVVRNMHKGFSEGVTDGGGIHAEADTLISNNVIEDVEASAISLGWGPYARNLSAQGNLIRKAGRGISFSVVEGAGKMLIAGNMIEGAVQGAIVGMDHDKVVTPELAAAGAAVPVNATLANNVVVGS